MYTIFNNSKSAMKANQDKMDVISNNIANINTNGYKKVDLQFVDLLSQTLDRQSYPTNSEDAITGTGVKTTSIIRDNTQGPLRETSIKSDIAIDGEGFYRVIRSNGEYAYTRNSSFSIDSSGKIVDNNQNILDIQFNQGYGYNNVNLKNMIVNKSGDIYIDDAKVGQINVYKPVGSNDLISIGDSLFSTVQNAQLAITKNSSIYQGYTELSNVNMQEEMVDMLTTQRAYQLGSRGIKIADDMWGMANNLQSR
jgi:flagellar basal-body rod protein FlgG